MVDLFSRVYGITHLSDVTEECVERYFLDGTLTRGWVPSTYQKCRSGMRFFFSWCLTRGLVASNVATVVPAKKLPRRILPRGLRKHEAELLLTSVRDYRLMESEFSRLRAHAVFAVLIFAGLRRAELLKLACSDVDMRQKELLVRQGKGQQDRVLPIIPALSEILSKYMKERQRRPHYTCRALFVDLAADRPMSLCSLVRLVRTARRASGIRFYLHQLRHTFATLMLEGGCDIYALSKLLGHSTVKTTEIYLGASSEHLRNQANKHPLNQA